MTDVAKTEAAQLIKSTVRAPVRTKALSTAEAAVAVFLELSASAWKLCYGVRIPNLFIIEISARTKGAQPNGIKGSTKAKN